MKGSQWRNKGYGVQSEGTKEKAVEMELATLQLLRKINLGRLLGFSFTSN